MRSPEGLYKGIINDLIREINDLKKWRRDVTGNNPLFDIANEDTRTLTGSQSNYDPGDYDVLRLDASVGIDISGMAGGKKGRFLELINVGSFTITLQHEAGASTAANRFLSSTGAAVAIAANERVRLYYDSTTERWRV